MGEADPSVAHAHDVGLNRLVERDAVAAAHRFDQRERGLSQRRGGSKPPARGGRQRLEPGRHQLFEGEGKSLAGLEAELAGAERAGQLEGIEGVAAGQVVQAPERGSGRHEAKPGLDQVLHGSQAERREREALQALTRRRTVKLERNRRVPRGSPCHKERDRPVVDPANGEAEHLSGSGVEPLHVINGDHQRPVIGKPLEHGQQAERDALLVGGLRSPVIEQKGDLECLAEPCRQALQSI